MRIFTLFIIVFAIYSCHDNTKIGNCSYTNKSKITESTQKYTYSIEEADSVVEFIYDDNQSTFSYTISSHLDTITLYQDKVLDYKSIYFGSKFIRVNNTELEIRKYIADIEYENLFIFYCQQFGIVLFSDPLFFDRCLNEFSGSKISPVEVVNKIKKDSIFYMPKVRTIQLN